MKLLVANTEEKTEGNITILPPYTVVHPLWERESAKTKGSEVPPSVCKISHVKAPPVSAETLHFLAMTPLPDF